MGWGPTVPKAGRKWRFTCINVIVQPIRSRGTTHAQGTVTSLPTLDVTTPLLLYRAKIVFRK